MSKVIYLQKTDIHSTLCTYWYCMAWMLWSAEQLGYDAYINCPKGLFLQSYNDDKKYSEQTNGFEWYFKQPKIKIPPPRNECEVWTWENWKDPTPVSFMAQPLEVIRDYYKKNLHFSDEVNQRGELLVKKYGLDFNNIIGLSWRGTDIYLDGRPRLPIEVYFPFIDDILEHNPYLRIMATAEEEQILDPLLARYPNAFKIEEFISSPFQSKHNPERLSNVSGFEKGLQPALMVWLFSKAAHYIKNRSSTGAVASWLSDGRIVCLGHEETLSYNLCVNEAEIEGIKYPLYR